MAEMWDANKSAIQREAYSYASKLFSEMRGAFVFGSWALILIVVVVLGFFAYQYVTAPKRPSYGMFEVPSGYVSIPPGNRSSVPQGVRVPNPKSVRRWS